VSRRPQWHEVKGLFEFDGSWNDIYVLNTSAETWARLLHALPHWPLEIHYRVGDSERALPDSFDTAVQPGGDAAVHLQIIAGSVDVRCQFFSEGQIEFDLDPRCVTDQVALDCVCDFMVRVSLATGREVLMTPENGQDIPLLEYRPVNEEWWFGRA
jgi:hypothetical protein